MITVLITSHQTLVVFVDYMNDDDEIQQHSALSTYVLITGLQ